MPGDQGKLQEYRCAREAEESLAVLGVVERDDAGGGTEAGGEAAEDAAGGGPGAEAAVQEPQRHCGDCGEEGGAEGRGDALGALEFAAAKIHV